MTTGGTETGVYNLNGTTNPTNETITRDETFWGSGGVAVASENEWYKAAYYQPVGAGGDTDSYWLYPTQSNAIEVADANYSSSVGSLTDVGTYSTDPSYYGTFDQGGNLQELNDSIVSSDRVRRGGTYDDFDFGGIGLRSSTRNTISPTSESNNIGFRVTSLAPIPEPSAYAGILGCLGLGLALTRRKGRSTL